MGNEQNRDKMTTSHLQRHSRTVNKRKKAFLVLSITSGLASRIPNTKARHSCFLTSLNNRNFTSWLRHSACWCADQKYSISKGFSPKGAKTCTPGHREAFDSTARKGKLTIPSLLGQLEVTVNGLLRTMGWSQWKGNFQTFQFKGLSAMENDCHGALFQVEAPGKVHLESMTVHLAGIPQP